MRLVLAALSRPITVVAAFIAAALCAFPALQQMPVDIARQTLMLGVAAAGGNPELFLKQASR